MDISRASYSHRERKARDGEEGEGEAVEVKQGREGEGDGVGGDRVYGVVGRGFIVAMSSLTALCAERWSSSFVCTIITSLSCQHNNASRFFHSLQTPASPTHRRHEEGRPDVRRRRWRLTQSAGCRKRFHSPLHSTRAGTEISAAVHSLAIQVDSSSLCDSTLPPPTSLSTLCSADHHHTSPLRLHLCLLAIARPLLPSPAAREMLCPAASAFLSAEEKR